jgi:radical SAM-linked protein
MIRQRVRLHFRKEGDLRLISHHDLLRLFERLFRRAGLKLSLSEGFHPKPRMTFPSALALGICGAAEVMDFELAEIADPMQLAERLAAQAPPGLAFVALRLLEPQAAKPHIEWAWYELPIPADRRADLQTRINHLNQQSSYGIEREGRSTPVDVRTVLDHLELAGDVLRFRVRVDSPASVRPREVLTALAVADLEHAGGYLTRTRLELAPENA